MNAVHLLVRVALAANLGAAGWRHLADGIKSKNLFLGSQPEWWPTPAWTPYHYGLPFVELTIGGLLLIGLLSRTSATIASLLFLALAVCTFDGKHPVAPEFLSACLLTTFAWILAAHGPGALSVDAKFKGGANAPKPKPVKE